MKSNSSILKIGVVTATAIVIANMVGTGVFTSLGFQVLGVKSIFSLLMLWVIGGIMALCGAFSYSELGSAIPRSGGEYTYLSKIYHPVLGFLSGFVSVFVGFAAPIALAAMALGGYFCTVFPECDKVWVGAIVVVLITIVHSTNLMVGSRFQNVVTSLKVLLIFVFIACGFVLGSHENISIAPAANSFSEIISMPFAISLIYVSYAYSGWNASAYIASEIDKPQRNLPRSIITGTIVVMLLYVLLNFIFLYTVPISGMQDAQGNPVIEIGSLSATNIFGITGGNIMSMIISILLISTISSMVFAGPRVTMVIGEDISSLKFFARKNKKNIPVIAIITQSIIALVFIFTSTFDFVLTYLGFTLTLFTTLTVIGVFVLRAKQPDLPRPFKTWGYPVTPIIFIGLNFWILYFTVSGKPEVALAGLITISAGLIFYFISKYFSKTNKTETV
ncbi:MAG TPA: amino acid permease [Bacteroidales bacterium]|nr:amino acid permease [Bacteroidales bacterium]HPS18333.1 amino acid permease [Bacteroidales bacterium]